MPGRQSSPFDITLTLSGDYAIRAMLDIARNAGGPRKRREIADACNIPQTLLPRILSMLVGAGLLDVAAGRSGGYRLSRAPSSISVLDIVEAVDRPPDTVNCVLTSTACSTTHPCEIHDLRIRIRETGLREMKKETLSRLLRKSMN